MSDEKPSCDVCGEEESLEQVYSNVDICRSCYMGRGYRIEQLESIIQRFLDGGRLESFVAQCSQAGLVMKKQPRPGLQKHSPAKCPEGFRGCQLCE